MYNIVQKTYPNGDIQLKIYDKPLDIKNNEYDDNIDIMYDIKRELYYSDKELSKEFCKEFEKQQLKDIKEELIKLQDTEDDKEKTRLYNRLRNDKRDKTKIYDKARANEWHWFATFTFDSSIVDRANYDECYKKLSTWLKNIRNRYCPNLKYLCVPELHSDGVNWHFHGLLANVEELTFVQAINGKKDSVYYGLPLKDNNGNDVYTLEEYRLGFATFTRVKDTRRVSHYITKYVTKSVSFKLEGRNRHLASRNLDLPKEEKIICSKEDIEILLDSVVPKWQKTKEVAKGTSFENKMKIIEL